MTTLNSIKNNLIDRILITKNEKLLLAINSIFDSTKSEEFLSFSKEQISMLKMSEIDIVNGDIVSELDNLD